MKEPVPEAAEAAAGGPSAGGVPAHLSSHGRSKVLQHRGLEGGAAAEGAEVSTTPKGLKAPRDQLLPCI